MPDEIQSLQDAKGNRYGPIISRKGDVRNPGVLPKKADQYKPHFVGQIQLSGIDMLYNAKKIAWDKKIVEPWNNAVKYVTTFGNHPALGGAAPQPPAPPGAPGGHYNIDDMPGSMKSYSTKATNDNDVLERAYQMLVKDVLAKGYEINDEAFFNDPDVLGHEDGNRKIRLSYKLRGRKQKALEVLAHEYIGHANGEPYGRDTALAQEYVARAMRELSGSTNKVANLNDYRNSIRGGSIMDRMAA